MANLAHRPSGVIQVEDVRLFIFDRTIEDNMIDLDLFFSDQEIMDAMRRTAMAYNGIPPYVEQVDPTRLVYGDVFLHGIAYQLCLSKVHQLSRNDIDYSAGGVTTNLIEKQRQYLMELLKFHKQEFDIKAKERQVHRNINNAFGPVG